jgi:Zn-dependent protease with chaperone function
MSAAEAGGAQHLDDPVVPPRRPRTGAGTTQRFVLLVGLFVAGSLSMLTDLLLLLTDPVNDLAGCALAAGVDPVHNSPANYLAEDTPAFHTCIDDHVGPWKLLGQPLVATAGVLVLAVILFLLIPRWKRHRTPVVPLAHAETADWLADLATSCGLSRTPDFVVDPTALFNANAVVHGHFGRYAVRLDMGLVKLFGTNRSAFKATLLHEFAHIRNRDVDITYLTVALWHVFLVGVLVPFVAVAGWKLASIELTDDRFNAMPPVLTRDLVLAAFMVVLMYLTTADLLRAREVYADLDAVAQGADAGYWTRQQQRPRRTVPGGRGGPAQAVGRAVRALLRTHPSWDERVAALADASAPVAVRAPHMFLTGVSVTILGYLLTFTPGLNNYLPSWLADPGVWPAAALATAVAGAAVWRGVVHADPGTARPSGLRAGLWLGFGHLVGELAANQFLGNEWTPKLPEAFLLLLLVLVPAAVLWWTAGCAGLFADVRPGRWRSAAGAAVLSVAGMAFAWWYGWWQAAGTTFAGGMPYSTSSALAFLNAGFSPTERMAPSTTAGVIANLTVVVVTLALYRWSVWLTAALWLVPLLRRSPGRSSGIVLGLLCGAGAGVGIIVVTHRTKVWIWHDGQSFVPAMTVYTSWLFTILLCGVIIAALAAAVLSRGSAATAAVAGCTAAVIGLIVLLVVNETDGCVPALNTVYSSCAVARSGDWDVFAFFLPELLAVAGMAGTVAALPVAVVARLATRTRVLAATGYGAKRRAVHLTCMATACTVLLGLGTSAYTTDAPTTGGSARERIPDPLITDLNKGRVSSLMLGLQVWAWGYFGGGDIMRDYEDDLADIDRGVKPNGSVDIPSMRRGCVNLIDAIDRASAYFPIPVSTEQPAWTAALAATRPAAQNCLRALASSNVQELNHALSALNPQPDPVATIIDHLTRLSEPTQRVLLPDRAAGRTDRVWK